MDERLESWATCSSCSRGKCVSGCGVSVPRAWTHVSCDVCWLPWVIKYQLKLNLHEPALNWSWCNDTCQCLTGCGILHQVGSSVAFLMCFVAPGVGLEDAGGYLRMAGQMDAWKKKVLLSAAWHTDQCLGALWQRGLKWCKDQRLVWLGLGRLWRSHQGCVELTCCCLVHLHQQVFIFHMLCNVCAVFHVFCTVCIPLQYHGDGTGFSTLI